MVMVMMMMMKMMMMMMMMMVDMIHTVRQRKMIGQLVTKSRSLIAKTDHGAKAKRVRRATKRAMPLGGDVILTCKVRFDHARIFLPQPRPQVSRVLIIQVVMVEQTEIGRTRALHLLVNKMDCAIFWVTGPDLCATAMQASIMSHYVIV